MRQSEFLKPGDAIYMVAPSFGVVIEPYATRYVEALKRFKSKGYRVIEGPNVYKAEGVAASADPKSRGEEINAAFSSEARLILSVGGGETMVEMLPYVDFDAIRNNPPKWFMGFSDNTNLTLPLALLSDTISVYGPCASAFYQKKWRLSEQDSFDLMQGKMRLEGYPKYAITKKNPLHPLWTYRLTQEKTIRQIGYEKPMNGRLLGGCLDCILGLVGTPFGDVQGFKKRHEEKIIWFLESCDLHPLSIRRGLFQLRQAGWFDDAEGILLGRHLCGNFELMGVNKYNAALDILGDLGIPILMDIDLGHVPPSLPIKVGALARVSLEQGNIIFDYQE